MQLPSVVVPTTTREEEPLDLLLKKPRARIPNLGDKIRAHKRSTDDVIVIEDPVKSTTYTQSRHGGERISVSDALYKETSSRLDQLDMMHRFVDEVVGRVGAFLKDVTTTGATSRYDEFVYRVPVQECVTELEKQAAMGWNSDRVYKELQQFYGLERSDVREDKKREYAYFYTLVKRFEKQQEPDPMDEEVEEATTGFPAYEKLKDHFLVENVAPLTMLQYKTILPLVATKPKAVPKKRVEMKAITFGPNGMEPPKNISSFAYIGLTPSFILVINQHLSTVKGLMKDPGLLISELFAVDEIRYRFAELIACTLARDRMHGSKTQIDHRRYVDWNEDMLRTYCFPNIEVQTKEIKDPSGKTIHVCSGLSYNDANYEHEKNEHRRVKK
jgi:hypothetical protein